MGDCKAEIMLQQQSRHCWSSCPPGMVGREGMERLLGKEGGWSQTLLALVRDGLGTVQA